MFYQSHYSQAQFHNNHMSNHFSMPAHSTRHHPGRRLNRSSRNLNFSRDFERFQMPDHDFTSIPNGSYPYYDLTRCRQNMSRLQQQYHRKPAFYFQDKSTFYYMSDPIITNNNRLTIQLTKVHIKPNGDQQRVVVEQDFSNENELKKFIKNFRYNFGKTSNNHDENKNTNNKKPSVIVIEEPDEEPKIYEQQIHNENIEPRFVNREQYKRFPLISSCSTIRSNKRQRNKIKYQRQNGNRNYEPPPRFQKENNFNIPPNLNPHEKFNAYQHRSRLHIPPRFVRLKDQQKSQPFRRTQQQPTIIAEHLVFTNNKHQQTRVDRARSECRSKIPIRNRNIIPQYFNYRQRYFIPLSTPILFRNTQIPFRLFNLYHPTSNHF